MELCLSKMSYIFNVLSSWNFAVGVDNINSLCENISNLCLRTQNGKIRVCISLFVQKLMFC